MSDLSVHVTLDDPVAQFLPRISIGSIYHLTNNDQIFAMVTHDEEKHVSRRLTTSLIQGVGPQHSQFLTRLLTFMVSDLERPNMAW